MTDKEKSKAPIDYTVLEGTEIVSDVELGDEADMRKELYFSYLTSHATPYPFKKTDRD